MYTQCHVYTVPTAHIQNRCAESAHGAIAPWSAPEDFGERTHSYILIENVFITSVHALFTLPKANI